MQKIEKIYKSWKIISKTVVVSIICRKWGSKHKRVFKEGESIAILKIVGLLKNV